MIHRDSLSYLSVSRIQIVMTHDSHCAPAETFSVTVLQSWSHEALAVDQHKLKMKLSRIRKACSSLANRFEPWWAWNRLKKKDRGETQWHLGMRENEIKPHRDRMRIEPMHATDPARKVPLHGRSWERRAKDRRVYGANLERISRGQSINRVQVDRPKALEFMKLAARACQSSLRKWCWEIMTFHPFWNKRKPRKRRKVASVL